MSAGLPVVTSDLPVFREFLTPGREFVQYGRLCLLGPSVRLEQERFAAIEQAMAEAGDRRGV